MDISQKREAWNKGKMIGQKPPLKPKDSGDRFWQPNTSHGGGCSQSASVPLSDSRPLLFSARHPARPSLVTEIDGNKQENNPTG